MFRPSVLQWKWHSVCVLVIAVGYCNKECILHNARVSHLYVFLYRTWYHGSKTVINYTSSGFSSAEFCLSFPPSLSLPPTALPLRISLFERQKERQRERDNTGTNMHFHWLFNSEGCYNSLSWARKKPRAIIKVPITWAIFQFFPRYNHRELGWTWSCQDLN